MTQTNEPIAENAAISPPRPAANAQYAARVLKLARSRSAAGGTAPTHGVEWSSSCGGL
jgi:hypothetical protein